MFPDNTSTWRGSVTRLKWTQAQTLWDRLENQPRRLQNSSEPCCLVAKIAAKWLRLFENKLVSKSEGKMMNAQCQVMPIGYKWEKWDVLLIVNLTETKDLEYVVLLLVVYFPRWLCFGLVHYIGVVQCALPISLLDGGFFRSMWCVATLRVSIEARCKLLLLLMAEIRLTTVDRQFIPLFARFRTSRVVQDFFHQQ